MICAREEFRTAPPLREQRWLLALAAMVEVS